MAVSDNNSANEGIVAREGAVVVGVFVPCYGFSILEFWMEHKNLMLRISYFSMRLAKEVLAKMEPIFEGSFAVCRNHVPAISKARSQNSRGIPEDSLRNTQPRLVVWTGSKPEME